MTPRPIKIALRLFTCIIFCLMFSKSHAQEGMTNARIQKILSTKTTIQEGSRLGYWQCIYREALVVVITDEAHNRMRIISPVAETKDLKKKDMQACLEANFDKALDVKYAISGEYLWAAFVHPLAELTTEQFIDAMKQVFFANANYGTSYQSTELIFGGGGEEEKK